MPAAWLLGQASEVIAAESLLSNPWLVGIVTSLLVGALFFVLGRQAANSSSKASRGKDTTGNSRTKLDLFLIANALLTGLMAAGIFFFMDRAFSWFRPTVEFGEPTGDSSFEVTVTDFDCGLDRIRGALLADVPQGQFCVANLTLVNRDEEATSPLFPSCSLHVGDQEFPSVEEIGSGFETDIFPNHEASGNVVFDIPSGTSPSFLECQFATFSRGFRVAL